MPRKKNWFKVSHDFLTDPDTIELIDTFGKGAVLMWLSMLSTANRNDGFVRGTPPYIARIHGVYLDRTHPKRAVKALVYMALKGWIREQKDGNSPAYYVINYSKYNNTTEQRGKFKNPKLSQTRQDKTRQDNINTPPENKLRDGFDIFWKGYPKKVGKEAAWKAWKKIKPDQALQKAIRKSVDDHKSWPAWEKNSGEFIPHPATYLNQGRWQDEAPSIVETKSAPYMKPLKDQV